MVYHALPVFDVSGAGVRGFCVVRSEAGAFKLAGLVHDMIRKTLQISMNYKLVRCFPYFPGATYGERFTDRPSFDGFTTLPAGVFAG